MKHNQFRITRRNNRGILCLSSSEHRRKKEYMTRSQLGVRPECQIPRVRLAHLTSFFFRVVARLHDVSLASVAVVGAFYVVANAHVLLKAVITPTVQQ